MYFRKIIYNENNKRRNQIQIQTDIYTKVSWLLNQGTRIIADVMMTPETSVCLNELQSLLSVEGMQIKVLVLSTPVRLVKTCLWWMLYWYKSF